MVTGVDYRNVFYKCFNTSGVPTSQFMIGDRKLKEAFDGKIPVGQLCNIVLNW